MVRRRWRDRAELRNAPASAANTRAQAGPQQSTVCRTRRARLPHVHPDARCMSPQRITPATLLTSTLSKDPAASSSWQASHPAPGLPGSAARRTRAPPAAPPSPPLLARRCRQTPPPGGRSWRPRRRRPRRAAPPRPAGQRAQAREGTAACVVFSSRPRRGRGPRHVCAACRTEQLTRQSCMRLALWAYGYSMLPAAPPRWILPATAAGREALQLALLVKGTATANPRSTAQRLLPPARPPLPACLAATRTPAGPSPAPQRW